MQGRDSRYAEGALLAVPALHKEGRQLSVEFTIQPFRDSSGAMLGIAAIMRDVTARFEETRALRRELEALKQQQ
jgi:PAS domain S-box-containing protein